MSSSQGPTGQSPFRKPIPPASTGARPDAAPARTGQLPITATPTAYVNARLLPGEQVLYRTTRHWASLAGLPVLFLVATFVAFPFSGGLAALLFVLTLLATLGVYLTYVTSEFALTDRRVMVKVGWLWRQSLEVLLSKVESVGVDQGIGGRIFGYGTLVISGTGGTHNALANIASPFEFYQRLQSQLATVREPRS